MCQFSFLVIKIANIGINIPEKLIKVTITNIKTRTKLTTFQKKHEFDKI